MSLIRESDDPRWVAIVVIIVALLAGAAIAYGQDPPDPDSAGAYTQEPPEYPEGHFCSPAGVVAGGKVIDSDHPCHCKNMGDPQESCEKPVTNDPVCTQYCHEKHCSCPLICESVHAK